MRVKEAITGGASTVYVYAGKEVIAEYGNGAATKIESTDYERDSASGLDYALARFYDSRLASFCSADPVEGRIGDPQSWNRYVYARNDPINVTDPGGRFWGILLTSSSMRLERLPHNQN